LFTLKTRFLGEASGTDKRLEVHTRCLEVAMMPLDPFSPISVQLDFFRITPVDVDELIASANQAFNGFGWGSWAPDPDDRVIDSLVRPPLTVSIVRQYANYRAWLEGRPPTQDFIGSIESELRGVWFAAQQNLEFGSVALVARDLHLWSAVRALPERDREGVRPELLRRFVPGSRALTGRRRGSPDPTGKDWMDEHSPATTRRIVDSTLTPIPPPTLG
jgi:hypothetical protein